MAKLRLVSWQMAPAEEPHGYVNVRTLVPLRTATANPARMERSFKVLALVLAMHIAAFWVLLATTADLTEKPKEAVAPMMVSLLAEPAPEPAPKAEPAPKIEIKPQPVAKKPVIKPERKPEFKPKVEPVPQPQAESTPPTQVQEAPPVSVDSYEPSAESKPVAAVPQAVEPQPAPEPVVEPPRFGVAYLKNPPPEYPPISRRMGEEGRVVLRVLVSSNGKAETVEIDSGSGSKRLDSAAKDAVKKWQFIPAKRNNEAISAYVLVPLKFELNS
jgi:protein TonB